MAMDRAVFLTSFKRFMGIDQADTSQDTELLGLIDESIQICNEYLGRELDENTWTEVFDRINDGLILTNWPITDLISITGPGDNELNLDNWRWSIRRNVVRFIPKTNEAMRYRYNNYNWWQTGPITVIYTAGYTDADIPTWVMISVNYIAASLYNMVDHGQTVFPSSSGVQKSVNIPGVYRIDYDTGGSSNSDNQFGIIPEAALQTLRFYRDRRIG